MARTKQQKNGSDKRRYTHHIPDRNAILEVLTERGRPMDYDALAEHFGIRARRDKKKLNEVLTRALRAGQIHLNRSEEYCLAERLHLVTGNVSAHKDGFGFLVTDDDSDDLYLSPREMQRLMHGDRVAGKVHKRTRRGSEGRVVDILERAHTEVAGKYIRERGIGLVIPDNPRLTQRVLIPQGEHGGAKAGEMVVAKILDYPEREAQATARIVQVLGAPDKRGMPTDLAIHAHGIPHQWPRAVAEQARSFGRTVPTRAKQGRKDLRNLPLVTIDGIDARDFDDAVYAAPRKDGGWRLVVAIADVAHYVTPDSPIDKEAIKRATSVYFPDRVVPMLPEVLSNGLCSLNPKVDRLCMVCDMSVSPQGEVTRSRFYDAVMRSHARLTYSTVGRYLEGETDADIEGDIAASVDALHGLYKAFAKRRQKRGAIELDLPQLRIRVDDSGDVERIISAPRNDAHRLIEECMIAANVEAARFITRKKVQALFRVHAKPDEERFEDFRAYMVGLGFKVPHAAHPKPGVLRNLMASAQDRPDAYAINMALLRTFAHAEYTPENIGHFGLALDQYAHFTSPIRRYPDLLVHRAIRHMTCGGKARAYGYSADRMQQLGKLTSERERRAEDATREVEALLKCQFMQKHLGGRFEGIVSGVTHFGLFVQLGELQVDGLVHVSSLRNDYYEHEPERQRLVGSRTGQSYTLGDSVEVIVDRVDLETRQIDFVLYDHHPAFGGKRDDKKRHGDHRGRR